MRLRKEGDTKEPISATRRGERWLYVNWGSTVEQQAPSGPRPGHHHHWQGRPALTTRHTTVSPRGAVWLRAPRGRSQGSTEEPTLRRSWACHFHSEKDKHRANTALEGAKGVWPQVYQLSVWSGLPQGPVALPINRGWHSTRTPMRGSRELTHVNTLVNSKTPPNFKGEDLKAFMLWILKCQNTSIL